MAQDEKKTSDKVKEAPVVEGHELRKTEESRKIETYLVTVPIAVKKFGDIPDKKISDPNYNDSSEGPFGLGPFVFPCLQRFNNVHSFLILYFLTVNTHGMIFALVDKSLNVYKSQLSLSILDKFLLDGIDYFAGCMVAMFIGYFGGRGNRAKWVAAASILIGLSAIAFAIPFYNYEIIKLHEIKEELCEEGKTAKVCEETFIPHKSICIFFFICGQILHGIAGMSIYILGVTFIFDHVPTKSSGFYLAIADVGLPIGYIVGFVAGKQAFTLPVQEAMQAVGHIQRFRILQRRWWKSFFTVAVLAFSTTLPLFCFPSSLPGAQKLRLEKRNEPPTIDRRLKNKEIKPNLKGILHAIWCLLRNPLLMTQIFCKVTESLTFKTTLLFLPEYLQTRFLMVPSRSVSITGSLLFIGSITGRFIGGFIIDRLEMNNKNKLKFIAISAVISIVLFLLTFFVECETVKFEGINDDYHSLGVLGNLTAPCNVDCGCTTSDYNAVCGRDETQYFSPCFAGCEATKTLQKEKTYYNCSCIKEGLTSTDDEGHYIDAVSGTCDTKCLTMPLFFAFYVSATVFCNLSVVPAILIILQSVPASWNSMGMGLTFTMSRLIVSLPGPLLIEAASDFTCHFWDINECGKKVHCWIFDKENLVYTFQIIFISLQGSTGFLCLYGLYRYDYVVKEKIEKLPTPFYGGDSVCSWHRSYLNSSQESVFSYQLVGSWHSAKIFISMDKHHYPLSHLLALE
ncbi:solute carrier organic anion transporter family member 6A1-like [Grammomys surdaster]|uniref:solute carrier organic anion transporter family member 6A1-like n=1 Tax=Grammomys surdaster TaxID=491861 RepID=UPI0010A0B756|nr:solute carrier organic anion transporter family member 6A1-like [Grammomys surdaster]